MDQALVQARRDAQQPRFDSHLKADTALHEMILRSADNRLFGHLAQLVNDRSVHIHSLTEPIIAVT
jgi:DNA-binding FadR family transcriptional regulator